MDAVFIELPPFERVRLDYLSDDDYRTLQTALMNNPTVGDVIQQTGGLRKMRFSEAKTGKGKRSGVRVIYYWWVERFQFLLFTIYSKGEMSDLTHSQRKILSNLLKSRKSE
ncbi:toxin [Yersinia massiliensis]|jgi:mRNA-degrading endonuclease RelE of RelBE toxin-antitoxin system|uniref:Toxin n=2 Tax=Yersinia TaxID=629 RepID=A0A2R4NMJ2_9GAMM|nr:MULTISPECIES: toxin [Yersinia]HEC1651298.1 toxin [Yersinia enterocolitica]ATM86791.1 toxin [Yersinia frederiksenii]AVX37341.1 toxin [Yersinia massiliensis]MCB5318154.1 toxin [Yersinia massiliensis]MDA5546215.1 toxin [Yersinia massiliensis]